MESGMKCCFKPTIANMAKIGTLRLYLKNVMLEAFQIKSSNNNNRP
jgi:hypothetical protein